MSDAIIKVEALGKQYRIGSLRRRYGSLRESLVNTAALAWRRAKGLFAGAAPGQGTEFFWALKDVSFEVRKGEVLGIIGRNGAGKSTLLKILSNVTEPTEGQATLRGRVGSLLEVGTGFHPELTGRENIYLSGAILGMRKTEIDRKFDDIVEFSGIEKFLDTPAKRYSSGMYVRLGFAVAAHLEPEILVIDEVLAVGDAEFQKKCLGKMGDVARSGRTVLFVSHNMPAVQALCSRAILLSEGRVAAEGSPDEVIGEYLSAGSARTGAVVDLRDFPRSGGHERAIQEAWLENDKGEVVTEVMMGQPVSLCFRFRTGTPLAGPAFGFGVENQIAQRIFSLNNYISGDKVPSNVTQGVARYHLPELALLPGHYAVSLSIAGDQATLADYMERALPLNVISSDVFGSGRILQASQGMVYARGRIHVD